MSDRINYPEAEDKKFVEGVFGFIEATTNELSYLHTHYDLSTQTQGLFVHVGTLDGRPVNINLTKGKYKDEDIIFYEAITPLVDWELIEEWIGLAAPISAYNGEKLRKTDATNPHLVLNEVRDDNEI